MVSKLKENERTHETCTKALIPVRDALDILSGKWKLPIIIALSFGNKRFSELAKQVQTRLGLSEKEAAKIKLCIVQQHMISRYLEDPNEVIGDVLQPTECIGLDHPDRSTKRTGGYERAIKIHN